MLPCALLGLLDSGAHAHMQTGRTLQIYRGHTAPVTCLAFYDKTPHSGDEKLLITGSWDKASDGAYN